MHKCPLYSRYSIRNINSILRAQNRNLKNFNYKMKIKTLKILELNQDPVKLHMILVKKKVDSTKKIENPKISEI